MQIDGPFNIKIVDNEQSGIRELHLDFQAAFQNAALEERQSQLDSYMQDLAQSIQQSTDTATQQGMLLIQQIAEELRPHIHADEVELNETIIIELGASSPLDKLLDGAILR